MENFICDVLACPVCGAGISVTEDGKSAVCSGAKRHLFDFSSAGYINLYTSRAAGGDGPECVAARRAFLSKGYYEPIAEAIKKLVQKYAQNSPRILDAGCGEGYYTRAMAEIENSSVFGFDISKAGVNLAAKSAKKEGRENVFFGVASSYSLPVRAESVDVLTTIFAPCAEEDFSRVLRKNGVLILAGAGKEHLLGLKKAIYDDAYENEGRRDLPKAHFSLAEETSVSYETMVNSAEDIQNLFAMTPYFYRTSSKDREKLRTLSSISTKIDVELFVYVKKQGIDFRNKEMYN